jgi:hypothetical protein
MARHDESNELFSMSAFNVGDTVKDAFHNLWKVASKTHFSYLLEGVGNDEQVEEMGNDVIHKYRLYRRAVRQAAQD